LCLLLQNDGPRCHPIAVAHVAHAQAQEIASAQLAVDAEIEQGKFSQASLHLQTNRMLQISFSLNGAFWPTNLLLFQAS